MVKKKKVVFAILACIAVIGIAVISFSVRKPFEGLEISDIASASVHVTPPDKTVPITDISELVEYLNDVVIYYEDNSYTEYIG